MSTVTSQEFFVWLDDWLSDQGISERELARRAGLSHSVISKARNGIQPIGYEACEKLSLAMNVPAETVFRLAGLLPSNGKSDPEGDELVEIFSQLDEDDQDDLLQLARTKVERLKKNKT